MRLSDHEIDPAKLGGVWWDFTTLSTCPGNVPHPTNGCFLIVPMLGNEAFTKLYSALQLPHAGTLRSKDTPEDAAQAIRRTIWATAMAKAVLRGWANWDDLPAFNEAKAVEILTDIRWLIVSEFIARACGENRAALAREEEQAKGN